MDSGNIASSPTADRRPPTLLAILVRGPRGTSPRFLESAEVVVGLGILGDRFADGLDKRPASTVMREVTLIERETIDAVKSECGLEFSHVESRRNLLVEGVRLNDLVGRRFKVGEVELEGVWPCQPCSHLEQTTRPGIRKALANRGGLRAKVITAGTIRRGDPIVI